MLLELPPEVLYIVVESLFRRHDGLMEFPVWSLATYSVKETYRQGWTEQQWSGSLINSGDCAACRLSETCSYLRGFVTSLCNRIWYNRYAIITRTPREYGHFNYISSMDLVHDPCRHMSTSSGIYIAPANFRGLLVNALDSSYKNLREKPTVTAINHDIKSEIKALDFRAMILDERRGFTTDVSHDIKVNFSRNIKGFEGKNEKITQICCNKRHWRPVSFLLEKYDSNVNYHQRLVNLALKQLAKSLSQSKSNQKALLTKKIERYEQKIDNCVAQSTKLRGELAKVNKSLKRAAEIEKYVSKRKKIKR